MQFYVRNVCTSEENGAIYFWNKIESSAEFLCNLDNGKIPVDWNRKEINAQDCEVMSAEFRRLKGPPALKHAFKTASSGESSNMTVGLAIIKLRNVSSAIMAAKSRQCWSDNKEGTSCKTCPDAPKREPNVSNMHIVGFMIMSGWCYTT